MAPGVSSGASNQTAPPDATTVHVLDFKIQPAALTIKGPSVTLFVVNDGPTVHNVTIRDASGMVLMATPDLRPGETAQLRGDLRPGAYVTFCSLPGHESLGTKGTLIVTG
jgi:plastocyanin